ncbi:hydrolase [Enterococcus durans]|uniref:hydrolase n=1 Tax=Enterococcus durans TaxID=53345 RepID=UPI000F4D3817|nr:hydrolase [Enterococcus durans]NJE65002.1 hydrolase [Enterococcus durans]QED60221.1 hydrolase [Enterococcus durans]QED62789.1 hydrolase [Enterococcus durans]ROX83991.1 hydrolase [Enterococcus durans]HJG21774.1 hydrolase [Enterococcus durans]
MTSLKPRDAAQDELLSPENSVFLLIDYQPTQVNSINSMDRHQLIENVTAVTNLLKEYQVPIILSTVNVATGRNQETIPQLKNVLADLPSYDRTSINAWEDAEFKAAVEATGRKKLIIAALWTEACLTFPTLDALQAGYEVYPVVDAVGGTNVIAHETALRRVEQAGAKLTTFAQLACEMQRDWNRGKTVPVFVKAMQDKGIFLKLQ